MLMDRKKYWNEDYVKYWKEVTKEANNKNGILTNIKKSGEGDFKVSGEKTVTALFDCLDYKMTDKLLDYGCGFGRFYPFFKDISDYYGIDLSSAMIEQCVKQWPERKERFIVAEGEMLPFKDEYFEKIICYGVFDACYQERALAEMLRVVRVGGVILFTGKNTNYWEDDEQALIAEEAARKKGHPNYFTDVKKMLLQLEKYVDIRLERYYKYRGDSAQTKYLRDMPDKFYEWTLVIEKNNHVNYEFEKFSDMYSATWYKKMGYRI